jgi:hypothetical protein
MEIIMQNVTPAKYTLRLLSVAALAGGIQSSASADIVRADAATATSEFNSSYRVLNAINGSGLPSGFGPGDAHATYATNNHWTTRGGETIGESATFTFNSPKTLGGMHMWAHRSNGVASNPYYAVTLFDLVLRDAQGNLLAEFKNLTGQPNVQIAQPVAFDVTENVSSIQFIVRATLNSNVSPYTGLAEVLFETCFPATSAAPLSVSSCPTGTINFQATPGGSGPFEYGWETLDDDGNWVDVQNGTFEIDGVPVATINGADAQLVQVTLDPALGTSQALSKWRCRITNPCNEAVSEPADLVICPTDFDCSGFTDTDDFTAFVLAFEEGLDAADFDGTGFVDTDDFTAFVLAFENGC